MTDQRVLVVEDERASWDILLQLLTYYDINADIAENAEDALHLLEQADYALAVIDLALPGMDGWELLQKIHANPDTESLNVVALTAFYDPGLARKAKQAGFSACYPKPATSSLVQDLRALLN